MRDYPDGNAKDLLGNLEKDGGWKCVRIRAGLQRKSGVPDSIVARVKQPTRINHLLEIKSLGGRLTEEQKEFARTWPGCVHVATNSWEANLLLNDCEESHR